MKSQSAAAAALASLPLHDPFLPTASHGFLGNICKLKLDWHSLSGQMEFGTAQRLKFKAEPRDVSRYQYKKQPPSFVGRVRIT